MTILWMNLALVFCFAVYSRYFSQLVIVDSVPSRIKPNRLLVLGSLVTLVLVSGLRSNIGDTFNYKNIYIENDFTWEYVLSQKDIGFGILQMYLKNYISDDPQIMLFVSALITNVLIVYVLYNYSRLIELSLYVYITGGLFLISMNGIRQVLAAAITFTAIKYLINGNFFKYALIIVFASFFHQSALILLPMFFLVRFKAWSKTTIALLLLSVIIVVVYEQFSNVLFNALEDTQYANYDTFAEGGANIIRVVVEIAPLLIAYLGRNKLKEIFPKSDFIVNMALIGVVFMVIATQQWIFARMSIYFQMYGLILISWLPKLFRERDQKLIYVGIIACYFLFYYFETVVTLHILYRSDYLSW